MDDQYAIVVRDLSKVYRIWDEPSSRMISPLLQAVGKLTNSQSLKNKAASRYVDFWALREISFAVRKGESVGIIGRNGSGKSSLLQAIAGTLQPTTGEVEKVGRVAALLELGSGFNPEFTGRENVYLNAAVLGLSRDEINEQFDEIVEFADIGDFLNQPVKTYSSGMMVRLAFAVTIAVKPDILIVDEALSVGDMGFQRRCFRRIEELRERGCTFLFVSHDINSVNNLCERAILLERGEILAMDDPKVCGNIYQQKVFGEKVKAEIKSYGTGDASFEDIWIQTIDGERVENIECGRPFEFCYRIKFHQIADNPVFGLRVTNVHGVLLTSTNTEMQGYRKTGAHQIDDEVVVKWRLNLPVSPGHLFFSAGCSYAEKDQFLCRKLDILRVPVFGQFRNAGLMDVVEWKGQQKVGGVVS